MNNFEFAEHMKLRTKALAVQIVRFYRELPRCDEARVLGRQVLRSGTSIAANYRAVCRAKSTADFVSKLGTVVEEVDETVLWFELFEEAGVCSGKDVENLRRESEELLHIFSSALAKARRSRELGETP
jgi:four helix bundle protein